MPEAGWYPDPERERTLRYWDGDAWSSHRAPDERSSTATTATTTTRAPVTPAPAAAVPAVGTGTASADASEDMAVYAWLLALFPILGIIVVIVFWELGAAPIFIVVLASFAFQALDVRQLRKRKLAFVETKPPALAKYLLLRYRATGTHPELPWIHGVALSVFLVLCVTSLLMVLS